MATRKKYTEPEFYEKKLDRVIERLGGDGVNYNWDRYGCWVEFRYNGQLYRFDHTVEKARERGQDINYGSDTFAQVVLAIEDLARIVERGIYDLGTWVAGLRYLPPPTEVPECFRLLGFDRVPSDGTEIDARFKTLSKQHHPDAGGSCDDFQIIKRAAEQAKRHMGARE